jgi:hypothetical protein
MKDSDLEVLFSSKTDEHATPQDFFDKINEEFNFNLDVCASDTDHKCEKYFTKEVDGLKQDWIGTCFMNPPYGREIINWVKKAYEESVKHGSTVVCLIPARTDTNWWHSYVAEKAEVRFVKGRLKFGGASNSAPFPSVVIIYGPGRVSNVVTNGKHEPQSNELSKDLSLLMKDYLSHKEKADQILNKIEKLFNNGD